MICNNCRQAADNKVKSEQAETTKLAKDLMGKAKTLHSKCKDTGCFCQHRMGKNTQ